MLAAVILSAGVLVDAAAPRLVPPALRPITQVVLGLLAWIALTFAMATAGVFTPVGLRIAAAASLLTAAGLLVIRGRPNVRGPWPDVPLMRLWPAALPALAAACVLLMVFPLALRPSPAWDASTYHLTIPRLYLAHGGFRPIQFNVYSNWPLNLELLFGLGMALHDYLLATLLQWLLATFIVWALMVACRRAGHERAGAMAACLFLANDVVLFEAGVAYVDLGLAFFFLMALVYLGEADRDSYRRQSLLLAGLCCGGMAGIKIIGAFGILIAVTLWLWRGWQQGALRAGIREAAVYLVLPAAILALPWYAKTAWYTGNPLYPFAYELLRGAEWSRRLSEQLQTWQASIGMGRTLRDYLQLPFRLALEGGPGYHRFDGSIAWTWLVAVPLIVAGCWRHATVRRAGVAALLYFLLWAASSQQARFFIPALALLSLATAIAVDSWLIRFRRSSVHDAALALAGVAVSWQLFIVASPTLEESRRWLARYRTDGARVLDEAASPIDRFINDALPHDARLLFLNVNTGFFCQREYVADSFFEASQINAFLFRNRRAVDIAAALRDQRFTHVLVGHDGWGIPYPETLTEYLAGNTDIIYTSPQGDVLHEIRRPSRRR